MQAVGDAAQGWANAVLYIFLSPKIRNQLCRNLIKCQLNGGGDESDSFLLLPHPSQNKKSTHNTDSGQKRNTPDLVHKPLMYGAAVSYKESSLESTSIYESAIQGESQA